MKAENLFKQGEDLFYGRNGVNVDQKAAFASFLSAAQMNNGFAACYVARFYEQGYNAVTISKSKAKEYDQMAADNGCLTSRALLYKDEKNEDRQKELFEGCLKEAEGGFVVACSVVASWFGKSTFLHWSECKTFEWYSKAAEQGYADAQYELCICHHIGRGVNRSREKEFELCKKAAEQGHASAQCRLGVYYINQMIMGYSSESGIEWIKKAATQGLEHAQLSLADCYYEGNYVDQSYDDAIEWWSKAAKQGDETAVCNVVFCYEKGQYGEKSSNTAKELYEDIVENGSAELQDYIGWHYKEHQLYEKALPWLIRSAEMGNRKAIENLQDDDLKKFFEINGKAIPILCLAKGLGLVDERYGLTIKSLSYGYEDQFNDDVRQVLREGVSQGDKIAKFNLGVCYDLDVNTEWEWNSEGGVGIWNTYQEYQEEQDCCAVSLYEEAAKQGLAIAQNNLGVCYYEGKGVKVSFEKAVELFSEAAEQGCVEAQFNLGMCYYLGNGAEKSVDKAVEWYNKAKEQNYVNAQYNLAVHYYNSEDSEEDSARAFDLFLELAEKEVSGAQYFVALCFYKGRGVKQSYAKSVEWLTKAVGEGGEFDWQKAAYLYGKAAENGVIHSMYMYGVCLEKGQGVKRNMVEAMKWYKCAAENGDEDAKRRIGSSPEKKRKTGEERSVSARRSDALSQIKSIIKVCLILLGIDVIVFLISLVVGNCEGSVVSFVALAVLFCMLVYYMISYYEKKS